MSRSQEFLAAQPSWVRKALQYDHSSFSQEENRDWANNQAEEFERRQEYERILKPSPAEWNKYCRKARQFRDTANRFQAQLILPKAHAGAPRKVELAQQAVLLQERGMNFPQIATELNNRHGNGTTTPDAIRKLLKRHLHLDKI